MGVGEHLDLHVTRIFEELLHVHRGVVEGGPGLGAGHVHGVEQRGLGVHHAHAAPAATGGGLDDHRVADGAADLGDFLRVIGQGAFGAGHAGHPGFPHGILGVDLVAHQANRFGTRTDESEAGFLDALGEIGVFRQKTVAGVDGLGISDFGSGDDGGYVEVALRRRGRADADRFVGELDVFRLGVGFRMHGDRAHPEFAAGAQYTQGYLAPVRYKDLAEHDQPITNIG